MGYSSDILWHQTTKEGFKNIMASSLFKCAYSLESINWKTQNQTFAIPMVSFCNLAMCDLSEYLGKYGTYTIGMKKTWKHFSKTSLVWYRDKNSLSLHPLMNYYKNLLKNPNSKIDNDKELLFWTQLSHTKNFEGPLERRRIKCYRFFDEFEFRYVPTMESLFTEHIKPILTPEEYVSYKESNKSSLINNENLGLSFNIKDIGFILMKDKGQIGYVNSLLKKNFKTEFQEKINNPIILTHEDIIRNIIGIGHDKKK